MRIPLYRIRNAAIAVVLPLALGACVVGPPGYYGDDYYGGGVRVAPPAPEVEYYGQAPYPGDIWIGGYWQWAGGGYRWQRGYWSAPRAGYYWEPHRWVRRGDGWRMEGGRWARGDRGEHRGWEHRDHDRGHDRDHD